MPKFPYDPTLTQSLQIAAELVCLKPLAERVEWVAFFLHEIESTSTPAAARLMLEKLQQRLANRLATGGW
ncbi:MAG: hypothetical protein NZ528_11925 [Caldilineales bacterium]|nr:hypothetical protein [Caldilineales bacterium]MDW8317585.1 hypothetical protein [Anaerolineae bacterium]